jgi:hypothetical protein
MMDETLFLEKIDHTNAILHGVKWEHGWNLRTQMKLMTWLDHMEFCELFYGCHLNGIIHEIY